MIVVIHALHGEGYPERQDSVKYLIETEYVNGAEVDINGALI